MIDLNISSSTWFPIVTLIIGTFLKYFLDILNEKRTSRREKEIRKEQRLDTMNLRRSEFQRATLLQLQDATHSVTRNTIRSHIFYIDKYKTTGRWQEDNVPSDIDEGFRKAQQEVFIYTSRVRDDEIRHFASSLTELASKAVSSRTPNEGSSTIKEIYNISQTLNEKIGLALRNLEQEEDSIAK
ncbi:hypothetical protein UAJ10_18780 [Nitrospirillum sp. BR 11164]|uniref:hypothetical protein n=1 Tax=Nitrospirillum sp. BR 11164 TaxID=3104324 RepID=UPI002AFE4333|nr:hypothetical protein [Nitrospirillum sp. BR 11164]MEA1651056.1 hypothetical protein [Nitrospirillum sp. BR 11164]